MGLQLVFMISMVKGVLKGNTWAHCYPEKGAEKYFTRSRIVIMYDPSSKLERGMEILQVSFHTFTNVIAPRIKISATPYG